MLSRWDVVCGDGDQGLFVHVLLVLRRGATFAYPVRDARWRVNHFFALHKPWGKKTRCLEYFDFMRDATWLSDGRNENDTRRHSHCLRKLEEKRGCLEAGGMASAVERQAMCAACMKNGQKNTCPMRHRGRAVLDRNGSQVIGTPFCPTAATRWWIF